MGCSGCELISHTFHTDFRPLSLSAFGKIQHGQSPGGSARQLQMSCRHQVTNINRELKSAIALPWLLMLLAHFVSLCQIG